MRAAADHSNLTISVMPDRFEQGDYTNIDEEYKDRPDSWRFTDFGRVRERSRDGSSTSRLVFLIPVGLLLISH